MLFLTVALVHMVALMSPGPDFFFVSQTAVSRCRKEAMMGVLGITCGVMMWAGAALSGLHLILEKMAWLHNIIVTGGGLYLCWMGYQVLRGALQQSPSSPAAPQAEAARSGRGFIQGLLTNLANPKVIIYFGSVFSLFGGDSVSNAQRWGILVMVVLETLVWFSVVASLFALAPMRRGYQRLTRWIDGIAGIVFAGFGIHLILSR